MFLPYSTDAPIYYFPFATIGLIAVNVLVGVAMVATALSDDPSAMDVWDAFALDFNAIRPWQWITNHFLHAGPVHLVGNMVFLWGFGLVVEGKLGWQRFLVIYLGMGVVDGAIVQLGMYFFSNSDSAALGASGIIFALIALAVVWAPVNTVSFFAWFIIPRMYELPIMVFGFIYAGFQLLLLMLQSFSMSSELLHLVGLLVGFPVGVALLKLGQVDCEGWDLFSVLAGETGRRPPTKEEVVRRSQDDNVRSVDRQRSTVIRSMESAMEANNPRVAASLLEKQKTLFDKEHAVPAELLHRVIVGLHREKQWEASVPLMKRLLGHVDQPRVAVRLKLAQILLQVSRRPHDALRVLRPLPQELPEKQSQLRDRLKRLAQRDIAEGRTELEIHEDE